MKVWLVISEWRDENGDVGNYWTCGVYDTYIKAKEKQGMYTYQWRKENRKIFYVGRNTVVSINKYGIRYIVYIEEKEVK